MATSRLTNLFGGNRNERRLCSNRRRDPDFRRRNGRALRATAAAGSAFGGEIARHNRIGHGPRHAALLALGLSTIVGSAYFFAATQQGELQALAAQSIQFDEALAQYGPEAKPARDQWKGALDRAHTLFWGAGTWTRRSSPSRRRWPACKP